MNRLHQQCVAAGCDLRTPPCLVTTNLEQALAFIERYEEVVTKMFSQGFVLADAQSALRAYGILRAHGMVTLPVTKEELVRAGADSLKAGPHLFQ